MARHTVGPKALPRRGVSAAGRAVGKGARKAWTATAPARAKTRRAAVRKAKAAPGAARDGLRALAAGAWTWLRKRDRHAALDRLRDVWARRRKRRASKAAPAPDPAVAAAVRRPTSTIPTTSTTGVSTVSGHHFVAPAMEMARIAAAYEPKGMLQVADDFAGLEEALRLHAEAMKISVENADAKQPLDPRIVDMMRQIHSLQLKAAEIAGELRPAFEKLHDVDLNRLRNPRKGKVGEAMWDATTNL